MELTKSQQRVLADAARHLEGLAAAPASLPPAARASVAKALPFRFASKRSPAAPDCRQVRSPRRFRHDAPSTTASCWDGSRGRDLAKASGDFWDNPQGGSREQAMRDLSGRDLPAQRPGRREMDPLNGAARQASAARGRLRLEAVRNGASKPSHEPTTSQRKPTSPVR